MEEDKKTADFGDLHRVTQSTLEEQISQACSQENDRLETETLNTIAKKAVTPDIMDDSIPHFNSTRSMVEEARSTYERLIADKQSPNERLMAQRSSKIEDKIRSATEESIMKLESHEGPCASYWARTSIGAKYATQTTRHREHDQHASELLDVSKELILKKYRIIMSHQRSKYWDDNEDKMVRDWKKVEEARSDAIDKAISKITDFAFLKFESVAEQSVSEMMDQYKKLLKRNSEVFYEDVTEDKKGSSGKTSVQRKALVQDVTEFGPSAISEVFARGFQETVDALKKFTVARSGVVVLHQDNKDAQVNLEELAEQVAAGYYSNYEKELAETNSVKVEAFKYEFIAKAEIMMLHQGIEDAEDSFKEDYPQGGLHPEILKTCLQEALSHPGIRKLQSSLADAKSKVLAARRILNEALEQAASEDVVAQAISDVTVAQSTYDKLLAQSTSEVEDEVKKVAEEKARRIKSQQDNPVAAVSCKEECATYSTCETVHEKGISEMLEASKELIMEKARMNMSHQDNYKEAVAHATSEVAAFAFSIFRWELDQVVSKMFAAKKEKLKERYILILSHQDNNDNGDDALERDLSDFRKSFERVDAQTFAKTVEALKRSTINRAGVIRSHEDECEDEKAVAQALSHTADAQALSHTVDVASSLFKKKLAAEIAKVLAATKESFKAQAREMMLLQVTSYQDKDVVEEDCHGEARVKANLEDVAAQSMPQTAAVASSTCENVLGLHLSQILNATTEVFKERTRIMTSGQGNKKSNVSCGAEMFAPTMSKIATEALSSFKKMIELGGSQMVVSAKKLYTDRARRRIMSHQDNEEEVSCGREESAQATSEVTAIVLTSERVVAQGVSKMVEASEELITERAGIIMSLQDNKEEMSSSRGAVGEDPVAQAISEVAAVAFSTFERVLAQGASKTMEATRELFLKKVRRKIDQDIKGNWMNAVAQVTSEATDFGLTYFQKELAQSVSETVKALKKCTIDRAGVIKSHQDYKDDKESCSKDAAKVAISEDVVTRATSRDVVAKASSGDVVTKATPGDMVSKATPGDVVAKATSGDAVTRATSHVADAQSTVFAQSASEVDNELKTSSLERAAKIRADQGDHETEISCRGEADLHIHCKRCQKNPGHHKFIPIRDFKLDHLPLGHRDNVIFEWIRAEADVTCRMSVDRISSKRPKYHPLLQDQEYSFSKFRGKKFTNGNMFATGQLNGAIKYSQKDNKDCECIECRKPGTHTPKKIWGKVTIHTACHVVYDDDEAQGTTCHFGYDSSRIDLRRCVKFTGLKVVSSDFTTDGTTLSYATHDVELFNRLNNLVQRRFAKYSEMLVKYELYSNIPGIGYPGAAPLYSSSSSIQKAPVYKPGPIVIISHPHGLSKQISVGMCIQRKTFGEKFKVKSQNVDIEMELVKYTYNTATCPGSSGAPVFRLPEKRGCFVCSFLWHSEGGKRDNNNNRSVELPEPVSFFQDDMESSRKDAVKHATSEGTVPQAAADVQLQSTFERVFAQSASEVEDELNKLAEKARRNRSHQD